MTQTRQGAYRKWQALLNMTEARGASRHEAETARRLADVLAKQWGFNREAEPTPKPDFYARYARAERTAAMRYNWEYRTCGKDRCRCMRGGLRHGPYKYAKRRDGRTVRSIYLGT